MPTTFLLRVWTRFFDPPERVWQVKTSQQAMDREFPFWSGFSVDVADMVAQARATGEASAQARFGPFDWPVQLAEVTDGERFVDRSQNLLYTTWRHEHRVEPTETGARYLDSVTFTPGFKAAKLQAVLTERFFVRRHKASADLLHPDPRTVGVSVLRVAQDEDPR